MTIVPLRPDGVIPATVAPPDAELVAKLEELLADAQSGQLRAIGYASIDRDRAIRHGWAGHADHHDMTAGVNLLAFRYMFVSQERDED